jgi:hypothetical protein
MTAPPKILAKENRGLLLDVVVFVLNIFLMQRLTSYVIELFSLVSAEEPLAQFIISVGALSMWVLPAAGAVMKRWHFHERLKRERRKFDWDEGAAGCLFNPLIYFCMNLVLVSAIIAGLGQFLFGRRAINSAAFFVPTIFLGLSATILQTYLIYRYFSPPKKPPKSEFLRHPESEMLGDVCIFVNMILYQVLWNLLTFAPLGRPSGPGEFIGRLLVLCFIALLIYFPPRMFYLAEDIHRRRTWLTMLLANSPVIIRVLIGANQWS